MQPPVAESILVNKCSSTESIVSADGLNGRNHFFGRSDEALYLAHAIFLSTGACSRVDLQLSWLWFEFAAGGKSHGHVCQSRP